MVFNVLRTSALVQVSHAMLLQRYSHNNKVNIMETLVIIFTNQASVTVWYKIKPSPTCL